mgnify:CR=1 FL=1
MILIRYILICIIGYLIIRSFIMYSEVGKPSAGKPGPEKKNKVPVKKVSKEIGEYIDYEEVKK